MKATNFQNTMINLPLPYFLIYFQPTSDKKRYVVGNLLMVKYYNQKLPQINRGGRQTFGVLFNCVGQYRKISNKGFDFLQKQKIL
jgi:hypothetical protein